MELRAFVHVLTVVPFRNFKWVTKPFRSNPKRRKLVAEPLESATPIVYINSYVSGMLAVGFGLKLADSIRRVCMNTKVDDQYKALYALFCRGLVPIPELWRNEPCD